MAGSGSRAWKAGESSESEGRVPPAKTTVGANPGRQRMSCKLPGWREWDGVEAELLSWAVEGLTGTTWHLTFTSEAQTGTARSGRLSLLLVRHPTFPSHRHPELPFGGPPQGGLGGRDHHGGGVLPQGNSPLLSLPWFRPIFRVLPSSVSGHPCTTLPVNSVSAGQPRPTSRLTFGN